MTDAVWTAGSYTGPFAGNYEQPGNWASFVVPTGTAYFSGSFMHTVVLSSAISVGGWTVVSAPYVFLSSVSLTFKGAGVISGAGSVLSNSGTVSFLNSSSAGYLAYSNAGTINFTNSSTAGNAYIGVTKTGTLNFMLGATAGDAAIVTESEGGKFGRVNFLGDGPAHDHKLTAGSFAGSGIFNLGANEVTVGNEADTLVSGQIIGSSHGRLVKVDYGRMTLTGVNTYGGGTVVLGGELIVNGKIGNVTVGHYDIDNYQYGWLEGDGAVGKITAINGLVSAGARAYAPGLLTARGLDLGHRSDLKVDIFGRSAPGASGYDQVIVKGAVHLSGGTLSIGNDQTDYDPVRHTLKIIDNDGKDKVSGTFGDDFDGVLKEGDAFRSGDQVYSVSYKGGTGNDVVLRNEGPVSRGTGNADTINLKTAPDHPTTNLADYVDAGSGDDTINSGGGNDTVDGYYGKDKMNGGAGVDLVYLGFAENGDLAVTLHGSKYATVELNGQAWDKIKNFEGVYGGNGNDRLTGDDKDNLIIGASGSDTIKGGNGDDTLIGGYEKDKLEGGNGHDRFVFTETPGTQDADKIADFHHGEDKLALDSESFAAIGTKFDAAEFYAHAGAHNANDKNHHIIYNPSNGKLYYDADGKGGDAAQLFATLTNHTFLTASDIVIV